MDTIKKKKVLFFLQSGVGGAERMTVAIAKSLDVSKFNVIFYLLERSSGSSITDFIPKEYTIKNLPKAFRFKLVKQLEQVLQSEKPDIVFSSIFFINIRLLTLSVFHRKIKFIIRNDNYLYTLSKFQRLIVYSTYWRADSIIAQTDEMGKELYNLPLLNKNRVKVLQNPIDVQRIDPLANEASPYTNIDKVKYVASGRFFPEKGFDILVKAFSIVISKQPNSELFIVGNTQGNCANYFQTILKLIETLGIKDKVHCVGYQKNPYKYVRNANCFVLSSRNEGLPNVLIEALYLGTPVAACTCIPVISRIVAEGKTGFLAESENVESLAEAMLNAAKLGRVQSTYKSAKIEDFAQLFNDPNID